MTEVVAAAQSEAQAVYTGERKNGRMEGYGTYRFPSGTVYTGDFLDVAISPEPEFGGGNYTIRFVPHHFTGLVAAHCHLFVHVAPGMIMYAPVSE